jgi:hypothetical protein
VGAPGSEGRVAGAGQPLSSAVMASNPVMAGSPANRVSA